MVWIEFWKRKKLIFFFLSGIACKKKKKQKTKIEELIIIQTCTYSSTTIQLQSIHNSSISILILTLVQLLKLWNYHESLKKISFINK